MTTSLAISGANVTLDSTAQLDEYKQIAKAEGLIIQRKVNVAAAQKKAEKTLDATFLAHAPMEPLNCTVKILKDKCEVWTGKQLPLLHQAEIAAFLGFKPEQVQLYTPYLGGSFGRRGSFSSDWVMEAVHIAKASGKYIKLVWSREDDIKGGYYRSVYVHAVQIGVGADGFPVVWQHRIVGQSLFTNTPLAKLIVQKGIDYSSVTKGAPYSNTIPDHSFELHTTPVGVPVLPWRSVGSTHTVFVIETLIDELATLAKTDPVDYRRSNFHDYRMLRIDETPVIDVHSVPSTEKMGGAGEPGTAPIAPALANAIFAATGNRIRRCPSSPQT